MSTRCNIMVASARGNRLSLFKELARTRALAILLYQDEESDTVFATCQSRYQLPGGTHKIGDAFGTVEVHTFGMEPLPEDTTVELNFEAASPDAGTMSIDQLSTIAVRLLPAPAPQVISNPV